MVVHVCLPEGLGSQIFPCLVSPPIMGFDRRAYALFCLVLQQVANLSEKLLLIAWFWCLRCLWLLRFLFLLGNLIDYLDEHEDTERYNQEVKASLKEVSIVDGSSLKFLARYVDGREGNLQVGEIDTADKPTDRRHDDIIDYGTNDFAECTTDDDTDCHVKHIAAHGEFLEFIQKCTHTFTFP